LVDDQSGFGEPGLREKFTTALTNLFIQDNSLEIADRAAANSMLEGVITSISDAPAVIGQGDQVSKRQITMSVKFTYNDMKLRKKIWEKSFSGWGQYDSGGGLSQRNIGLDEAVKKLTEDILLETVSNW
jgi:aspartate oxidase